MARRKYKTRDEIVQHLTYIYQECISLRLDHPRLMAKRVTVWESRDFLRLTGLDREYIRGYERCLDVQVLKPRLESGSWVTMPDGSVQYFGATERLRNSIAQLREMFPSIAEYGVHKYIYEHSIPERSGLYFIEEGERAGKYPYFIPAIHMTKPTAA